MLCWAVLLPPDYSIISGKSQEKFTHAFIWGQSAVLLSPITLSAGQLELVPLMTFGIFAKLAVFLVLQLAVFLLE